MTRAFLDLEQDGRLRKCISRLLRDSEKNGRAEIYRAESLDEIWEAKSVYRWPSLYIRH